MGTHNLCFEQKYEKYQNFLSGNFPFLVVKFSICIFELAIFINLIYLGFAYRIRPNYCTVRLGFSKLLGTLSCGKICIYLLRIHYKKDQKRTYLMMIMRFFSDFLY